MGFRFRRSLRIAPGVRLNLSKSGLGVSAGVKGARIGVGPRGLRTTVSIPGTGISYTRTTSLKPKGTRKPSRSARAPQITPAAPGRVVVYPEEQAAIAARLERTGDKSPLVAALLSLVICGAGQWYCGQRGKAVLYFLGWILLIPWPFAIVNAWRSARTYNLALVEARRRIAAASAAGEPLELPWQESEGE